RLAQKERIQASGDAVERLELAEALIARALRPDTSDDDAKRTFGDARAVALEAEKLGAFGPRVQSAVAVAAWYLGAADEAHARAVAAMSGKSPSDPDTWGSMIVLGLFAEARQAAVSKAIHDKTPWPGEWLTDVHAAYTVLARHPDGTDAQVAAHFDF